MIVNILCFETMTMEIIKSTALFETYYTCLTMYRDLIIIRCVIENKHLIYVAKSKDRKHKHFKLMLWKYNVNVLNVTTCIFFCMNWARIVICAYRYHILTYMSSSFFNSSVIQKK